MNVKILMEHNLEFLSLKGCCTGLSESTLVKMPHCWESHVMYIIIDSSYYVIVFVCLRSSIHFSWFVIYDCGISVADPEGVQGVGLNPFQAPCF